MLRTLAFVIMMTGGLMASAFSTFAALLVYMWFSLFRPVEWLWIDISSLRLSLILGLILVGRSLLTRVYPNLTHPLSIGTLLLLVTGLVAQTNAVRPDIGWAWLDFQARLTLVTLLAITLINTKERFLLALAVIGGSLGFHTAKAGLASIIGGGVQFYEGLGGSLADNNSYALAAVMIVPFMIAAAQNYSKSALRRCVSLGYYAAVPLSALTVVSLFSRGGFLALAAAAIVLVAVQKRRVLALLLVSSVIAPVVAVVPIPKGYGSRIETIRTYEEVQEGSALGRVHFWQVAWIMAKANPLGVGVRNFNATYDKYDSSRGKFGGQRSVHNSHLQVLTEYGFAGFGIWTLMFIGAGRIAWRVRKASQKAPWPPDERQFLFTMSNALIISMVGFLVGGAFISMALNELTWFTFGLVAALDRISARMMQERNAASVVGATAVR